VKQVVIREERGIQNGPSYRTPSKRRQPSHIYTKCFKQASIHLWGQGVSAELASSMIKRYTSRVCSVFDTR